MTSRTRENPDHPDLGRNREREEKQTGVPQER